MTFLLLVVPVPMKRVEAILTRAISPLAFSRERTDRDENVINLILHIFRNLAAIEDRRAKSTASTEAIEQSHLQVSIPSLFIISSTTES